MAFSSFHFQSPKVKIQAKAVSPHRSLHFLHGARLYWAPARHTWTHFAIPRGARIIPKQFHLFYFSNINAQPNWKPPPPPLPKNGRSARGEKTHKDLSDGNAILIATRALQTPERAGARKRNHFLEHLSQSFVRFSVSILWWKQTDTWHAERNRGMF